LPLHPSWFDNLTMNGAFIGYDKKIDLTLSVLGKSNLNIEMLATCISASNIGGIRQFNHGVRHAISGVVDSEKTFGGCAFYFLGLGHRRLKDNLPPAITGRLIRNGILSNLVAFLVSITGNPFEL